MKLKLIQGDITQVAADAIVNAANSRLAGGGGVDGAIHRAGGAEIARACKEIIASRGSLKAGEAVATTAGDLPARIVIHTVGPVWHGGDRNEAKALRACYLNSLKVAAENNCSMVAFSAISTGVYGYPRNQAAAVAVQAVRDSDQPITEVVFVVFDEENHKLYEQLLNTN